MRNHSVHSYRRRRQAAGSARTTNGTPSVYVNPDFNPTEEEYTYPRGFSMPRMPAPSLPEPTYHIYEEIKDDEVDPDPDKEHATSEATDEVAEDSINVVEYGAYLSPHDISPSPVPVEWLSPSVGKNSEHV